MTASAFPPNCPWCGKLMTPDEIKRHHIGCPEPDPDYNPPETQRLREFLRLFYGEDTSQEQLEKAANFRQQLIARLKAQP